MAEATGRVYTIGHSSRSFEQLAGMLEAHGVRTLVDVRRHPGSRRHPHFARSALERSLAERGIAYVHEEALGGRRRPREGSPNGAWRDEQFRGYADHMASEAFRAALARLERRAAAGPAAVMCAEAHPSRCHRRLLADALAARGWDVGHILERDRLEPHEMHPDARVGEDGAVTYPGSDQLGLFRS